MDEPVELHFLVPRHDGAAILAAHGDDRLPSATLIAPRNAPIVQSAAPRVDAMLGGRVPILETHLPGEGHAGEPLVVLVVTESPPADWLPPERLAWRAVDGSPPVVPARVEPRLRCLLDELRTAAAPPVLRPRWARPGWFSRAADWMADRLAEHGRPPTGPIEQTHLRGISAVLRAPTRDGSAYLKAVFPPFHHEPAVTELLELRVGPAVPRVLATEPDEGWLLMDDLGPDVVGDADEAASEAAIRALVAIQRALTGAIGELIDLGCPVRRLADLPADLAGALDRSSRLESVGPVLEEPRRIAWVEQAVRVVGDLGLPATLVHGDFHSLNVVRRDGRYVIFDWSDAALSHPLVDVATWLEWIDEPGRRAAAWGAWLAAWADACSPDSVRPLLDIVTGVGAAYQVVSYVGILEALEPATRSTMSRGMTTFLRRLDASIAGS